MLVKSKVFTRAEDVWNESLYKEAYADDEAGEDYAEWENTEGRVAISASDWVDYLNWFKNKIIVTHLSCWATGLKQ